MKSIFTYIDYRCYIADWYEEQQESGKPVSYRDIAQFVGYKSPAHITMLLRGKTRLSPEKTLKFTRLFMFRKKEADYFSLLVEYSHSKGIRQKKNVYARLLKFKECGTVLLDPDQYEYYQKWYYAVIHDIISFYPFRGDFKALARMVEPSITTREAQGAVRLLERIGFIEKSGDGFYVSCYPGISAYAEERNVVLSSYAESMIDRAKYALDKLPDEERLVSWAGFSVSGETYKKMRAEARAFRKRLVEMAQKDPSPERVFHLNLQMFPVSKKQLRKEDKA